MAGGQSERATSQHWPIGTEAELEALEDALDEIKHYWSTNQMEKIPDPLERARALADGLEPVEESEGGESELPRWAVTSEAFTAEDLYPDRGELEARVREHAEEVFAPLPRDYDIADIEIERTYLDDGVVLYRISHPKMGVLKT